ncbi:dihydrofolate reductase family protein [Hamadaea sp. NPDC051192]|uniref:dihydrofolate reductase family protein n=1 Tax=Hamadaea sp. NPDC051192 TaxID=3154940 RepID=UPI00342D4507
MNFIASADGSAVLDGRSGGLGNANDQALMGVLRKASDVVLVGAGTVRTEGYDLVQPRMAIVTRRLDLDPATFGDAIIVTVAAAPGRDRFRDVIIAGDTEVDVPTMLAGLAERGLTRVLCEGGPSLVGTLEAAGAVDELCLTISPVLAGPGGTRITAGPPSPPQRMELAHLLTDGELLFTRYTRAAP